MTLHLPSIIHQSFSTHMQFENGSYPKSVVNCDNYLPRMSVETMTEFRSLRRTSPEALPRVLHPQMKQRPADLSECLARDSTTRVTDEVPSADAATSRRWDDESWDDRHLGLNYTSSWLTRHRKNSLCRLSSHFRVIMSSYMRRVIDFKNSRPSIRSLTGSSSWLQAVRCSDTPWRRDRLSIDCPSVLWQHRRTVNNRFDERFIVAVDVAYRQI